jgi:hypothetical protein
MGPRQYSNIAGYAVEQLMWDQGYERGSVRVIA